MGSASLWPLSPRYPGWDRRHWCLRAVWLMVGTVGGMEPFVTRATDRLVLRRPVADDADAVLGYWSDPEVHRFLQHPVSDDLAETQAFLLHLASEWEKGECFGWGIVEAATGRFVGMIEARILPQRRRAGLCAASGRVGPRYMPEAVVAVVDWALDQPDVHRVWAYVHTENVASQRVLEKAGMMNEGILHRWAPRHDDGLPPADAFMYAIWVE